MKDNKPAAQERQMVPATQNSHSFEISIIPQSVYARTLDEMERQPISKAQVQKIRNENPEYQQLSYMATRIILEQEANWRLKLFAQVLGDEIRKREDLHRQMELGVSPDGSRVIEIQKFLEWFKTQNSELLVIIQDWSDVLNNQCANVIQDSANTEEFLPAVEVAMKVGMLYERALKWSIHTMKTQVHPGFQKTGWKLTSMIRPFLFELLVLGLNLTARIEEAVLSTPEGEAIHLSLRINLEVGAHDLGDTMEEEFEALIRQQASGAFQVQSSSQS